MTTPVMAAANPGSSVVGRGTANRRIATQATPNHTTGDVHNAPASRVSSTPARLPSVEAIRAEVWTARHQPAAQLPDGDKRQGREEEDEAEEEVDGQPLRHRARAARTHAQLFEERDSRDAFELPRLQHESESDQQAELPDEQWDGEREVDAVATRECVSKTKPGEAREQAEVLVESEELEHRPLPPDHRELEEQAQPGRASDGEVHIAERQRVEERDLISRIGIDRRLEATQQQVEQPAGRQYHGHREQGGPERDGLAAMEQGCCGEYRGGEGARRERDDRTAQEGPGHGGPNQPAGDDAVQPVRRSANFY